MSVAVDGLSASSLSLQDSQNQYTPAGGTPLQWIDWEGTVNTGTNPTTTTTSTSLNVTGYYPWMSVYLSASTGTGSVYVALYGWKTPSLLATSGPGGGSSAGIPLQKGTGTGSFANSSVSDDGTTVSSPEAASFLSQSLGDGTKSGLIYFFGKTSGASALAAADVAASTAIAYVWPTTNGTTGQFLQDTGTTTCPTLPTIGGTSPPSTCHLMAWTSNTAVVPYFGNFGVTPSWANNATTYTQFGGSAIRTAEATASITASRAGTISTVRVSTGATNGASSITFTVRVNGADCTTPSTISVAIAASAVAATYTDLTHSCTFAAGDKINFKAVTSNGGVAVTAVTDYSLEIAYQ